MPAIFPNAFCMAFELATYGLVAGILSEKMKKDIKSLYISLIAAMLCGRIVWDWFQQQYMHLQEGSLPGNCF